VPGLAGAYVATGHSVWLKLNTSNRELIDLTE